LIHNDDVKIHPSYEMIMAFKNSSYFKVGGH